MKRLVAIALLVAGCAGSSPQASAPVRPIDEDPLQLLPSGADLLADIDVEQLRRWPPSRRLLGLLPPDAQARLAKLGFDPLNDIDRVLVSVTGLGTKQTASTMLLFGNVPVERAENALGPPSEVAQASYRDSYVLEGPDGALARISSKLLVLGSRADVRRVLDLVRAEGDSLRKSAGDRGLLRAFLRCPTAKVGRPAMMLAAIPPEALRDGLKKEDLPGYQIDWLALSLAVGDGFDVGGVAGLAGPSEAAALVESAQIRLQDFSERLAVRVLGLKPYLDPIVLKQRESEIHFAYRLPAPTVNQMLSRLESLQQMAQGRAKDVQPVKRPMQELDR